MKEAEAMQQWGAFRIGGHEFALPIEGLLEVASCRGLMPLPDTAPFVRGGFDLRGTIVPVVDLQSRLGLAETESSVALVVVVRVGEHIVGIAVDAVTGTFPADHSAFQPLQGAASDAVLVTGCLQRAPGRLVSSLSAEVLATMPGMPLAFDRERRSVPQSASRDGTAAMATESLLLLRSGNLRFAVDALRVQSTMWEPRLFESSLTGGACRGEVEHRGRTVPVLELTELLGFAVNGSAGGNGVRQAFVVELAAGMVVMLVDHVAEIAQVERSALRRLPDFVFPEARFIRGVCKVGADDLEADHLVVDLEALIAREDIRVLAGMNGVRRRDATGDRAVRTAAAKSVDRDVVPSGRRLATFTIGGGFGVVLEDLAEVLACPRSAPVFGDDHMVRHIMDHRDRSIPVVGMSHLLVGEPRDVPEECVLVVSCGEQLLGFAVPALQSLESATWERPMPDSIRAVEGDLRGGGAERTMARLGTGDDHRMVEVLDLQGFARRLLGELATAAAPQTSMPSRDSSAALATSATVPAGCT